MLKIKRYTACKMGERFPARYRSTYLFLIKNKACTALLNLLNANCMNGILGSLKYFWLIVSIYILNYIYFWYLFLSLKLTGWEKEDSLTPYLSLSDKFKKLQLSKRMRSKHMKGNILVGSSPKHICAWGFALIH